MQGDRRLSGGNGNDVHRYFGELDDLHGPLAQSATEAAAAAAVAASVAEGEELLRQQKRIRSAAAAAATAERPPLGNHNTEGEQRTASLASTDPSSSRPTSTSTTSRPTSGSSTATAPTTATATPHPSNTIFAVGNPRAAPPPPSASRGAPGSSSRGGGGGDGGARPAGVDFGGLTGGQHVSPPLTGRSSEESGSVSWCSDNHTNNTFSSECSSVSGRGPGGFSGSSGSGRLMRGVSGSSGGGSVFLRSSSHINAARRGSGSGGDGRSTDGCPNKRHRRVVAVI